MTPADQVSQTLARLGLAATELGAAGATIARRQHAEATVTLGAAPSDLALVRELGRGGMGVVHLAEQRSLGREVAVKKTIGNEATQRALIREARLMGSLEHPNVVPVHALGLDADGSPVLVMKRVEGVTWRALMNEPDHEAWKGLLAGHGDRLHAHVEILSQVSRALAFAHDRGVVHRDVKPDNVMVGRFGEVLLLDWGVALRLGERDSEPDGIVGTPGYIAPEMVHADPHRIDARTDVFLLGATLYEQLAGHMPHDAPTAMAALTMSLCGERAPLPADAPRELADLAEHAMALDPAARIPDAESFRAGLARFLASREAESLARDAEQATTRAKAFVEAGDSGGAFRALIEARSSALAATRLRPADDRIRALKDACLAALVELELKRASPSAARAFHAEMSDRRPQLEAAIEDVEGRLAAERRAAESDRRARVERDLSPMLQWGIAIWLLGSAIAVAAMLALGAATQAPSPWDTFVVTLPVEVIASILILIGRRRLLANAATRAMFLFLWLWTFIGPAVAMIGMLRGDRAYDFPLAFVAGLVLCSFATVTVIAELWPVLPLHVLALVAFIVDPSRQALVQMAFVALVAPLVVRALWLRAQRTRLEATPASGPVAR